MTTKRHKKSTKKKQKKTKKRSIRTKMQPENYMEQKAIKKGIKNQKGLKNATKKE